MKTLYTAEATARGGRQGSARTSDGNLEVEIVPPAELGGPGGSGTNPEQLFAAGYAACFGSAMAVVAGKRGQDVSDSSVTGRVALGQIDGGAFGLAVELRVELPSMEQEEAEKLVARAHQVCPYSNATRGNIDVALTVEAGGVAAAAG